MINRAMTPLLLPPTPPPILPILISAHSRSASLSFHHAAPIGYTPTPILKTILQPSAKRFLTYAPFAKQCDFHKSPAKYRLFGGAAGPGKSMALLMEAIVQANDNMGSNTLLLRRTFPELEQSLLLYFRKEIPRELYSSFNDSKHVVTWLNGSTTQIRILRRRK